MVSIPSYRLDGKARLSFLGVPKITLSPSTLQKGQGEDGVACQYPDNNLSDHHLKGVH